MPTRSPSELRALQAPLGSVYIRQIVSAFTHTSPISTVSVSLRSPGRPLGSTSPYFFEYFFSPLNETFYSSRVPPFPKRPAGNHLFTPHRLFSPQSNNLNPNRFSLGFSRNFSVGSLTRLPPPSRHSCVPKPCAAPGPNHRSIASRSPACSDQPRAAPCS